MDRMSQISFDAAASYSLLHGDGVSMDGLPIAAADLLFWNTVGPCGQGGATRRHQNR